MIKVNVIVKENAWYRYIKNPSLYLNSKLKKIQNDKFFSNKNIYIFNLLLSGSKEIKILNKKFRKKNKTTDILSFPNQNKKDLNKLKRKKIPIYLGDMVINLKKLNLKSKKIFNESFNILWIHGLLHLFGHVHEKDRDFKKMFFYEKKFLKKIQ